MNMKKEYRRELKQLDRNEKKLWGDLDNYVQRQERAATLMLKDRAKAKKRVEREIERLDRRRAILQGRLS